MVIGLEGGIGKGSARSVSGVDLGAAVQPVNGPEFDIADMTAIAAQTDSQQLLIQRAAA